MGCTISNNAITKIGGVGIGGGINTVGSYYLTIKDCIIEGNVSNGYGGSGVSGTVHLENCTVTNNTGYQGSGGRGAVLLIGGNFSSITNCTIADNSGWGVEGIDHVTVVNTIVWGNDDGSISPAGLTVTYSDVEGGYGDEEDNNIDADPLFNKDEDTPDPELDDYYIVKDSDRAAYLGKNSPCIDKVVDTTAPDYDIVGTSRPQGMDSDMGAYESTCIDVDGDDYCEEDDDCNDGDAAINPGADEDCGSETDYNCDGYAYNLAVFPGESIQAAIDAASDSATCDEVVVEPGTYSENLLFDDNHSKSLLVRALNDATSLLDPYGSSASIINGGETDGSIVVFKYNYWPTEKYHIFKGFTITGGEGEAYLDGTAGGGIIISSSAPTIENCVVDNNSATLYGGGMFVSNTIDDDRLIIRDSIISNNTVTKIGGVGTGGGINAVGSYYFAIRECIIEGNVSNGYGGGGVAGSVRLENCTVTNNTGVVGAGVLLAGGGLYSSITNSTIADNNGDGVVSTAMTTGTIVNTIVWGNTFQLAGDYLTVTYSDVEDGYTGTGNIDADPLFVGSGDYHLTSDSTDCIDAGTTSGAPPYDIDGDARDDGYPDMGSDEYVE